MERYLVFDSQCVTCTDLARVLSQVAGQKLTGITIHGPEARELLDRAFPGGWAFAPYLVTVQGGHVRAWTGAAAVARLAVALGPRRAWKVWTLLGTSGSAGVDASAQRADMHVGRRSFLKKAGLVTSVMFGVAIDRSTAHACVPCDSCGYRCYYTSCPVVDSCFSNGQLRQYRCNAYDCYDARTGEYCYSYITNCCCGCSC